MKVIFTIRATATYTSSMIDRNDLLNWLKNNNAFTDDTCRTLTSGITRRIKNNPDTLHRFQEVTSLQTDNPAELIYNIVNPDCSRVCEVCGAPTTFDKYYNGYRKTCSKQCASALTVKGSKQSKLERYGSENYNNKEKNQQTKLERYGDAFFTNIEKGRQTKEARYGDANYNNSEKNKVTCLERYGYERASQAPEVKEKQRNTVMKKYGVSSPMQCEKVKQRYMQNYTEKNGVPWPLQNREVRKKFNFSKETSNEKAIEEFLKNRGFNYKYRYVCNGKEFDFAVFNEHNNLSVLIETDGEYFHGLLSDCDGKNVRGETDCTRFQKVPDGVKLVIADATRRHEDVFQEILRVFDLDYDSWINEIVESLSESFPYPSYSEDRMLKDWEHLKTYTYNPYQKLAMSVVRNFHKSIYSAHVDGKPSPLEAWSDKDLLRKCVENRFIYSSSLSSQAIADGFNVCKLAPKVSVFNPSLAKHLVDTYLNEFDKIFDPFSGFSGRMLGTCASGKRYIGQDIDKEHVVESNEIIKFHNLNASVVEKDVLQSSGNYECLFTCPPYTDKESWGDVANQTIKSCDEWIDECLQRFNCERYLFVVDETSKYDGYIVEELSNQSLFGKGKEKVVLIEKNSLV